MASCFKNFDFEGFWKESEYSLTTYTGSPLTEENVERAEKCLGYKLPKAYKELLKNKNGGIPKLESLFVTAHQQVTTL